MVDTAIRMAEVIQDGMSKPYSRKWLEMVLFAQLRQGLIDEQQVIDWAYAGDVIASDALLKVYADMVDHDEQPSVTLRAFAVKSLKGGRLTRGRGRYWYDDWRKDIGIAVLVYMTCQQFGLDPTRSRDRKWRQQPSGAMIVAQALGKLGERRIHMRERTVENIWWKHQGKIAAFLAGNPV